MIRVPRYAALFGLASVLVLGVTSAHAVLTFDTAAEYSDNFSSPLWNPPDGVSTFAWQSDGGGGGYLVEIPKDGSDGANNRGLIAYDANGDAAGATTFSQVSVEFDLMVRGTYTGNYVFFGLSPDFTTGSGYGVNMMVDNAWSPEAIEEIAIYSGHDTSKWWPAGATSATTAYSQLGTLDEWYHVAVDYTLDGSGDRAISYTISNSGGDEVTDSATLTGNATAALDGEFYFWNSGYSSSDRVPADGFYRIDNFQITEIPEPASMALLGVGGLLIWRRRRA